MIRWFRRSRRHYRTGHSISRSTPLRVEAFEDRLLLSNGMNPASPPGNEGNVSVAGRVATSTELAVSTDQAVFGESVTLSAQVTPDLPIGVPTGSVIFLANQTVLDIVQLNGSGAAQLTVTSLPVGVPAITARYTGNDSFDESTSEAIGIRVTRAETVTVLQANPARTGEAITFTIFVSAQQPSTATARGTVTLISDGTVIATLQLVDGRATFTTSQIAMGLHTVTARFEGSNEFVTSRSELLVFVGEVNERWVAQIYRDLLGREADPGGLRRFVELLGRGESFVQVSLRIMYECCEFFQLTVRNLYRAYLRRDADPAGLAAHVGWLRSGRTIAEVKANILGSAEYFFNPVWGGGGTNSGFMTALFRDVLGRGISGPDRTFWTQVLAQGAARYSVSLAVLRSRESLEGIGANYVQRLLRRPASAEEIAALAAALQSGSREEEIIATIVSSAEYVGSV